MQFESTSRSAGKAITKVDYSSKKQQQLRKDVKSSIVVGEDVGYIVVGAGVVGSSSFLVV